MNSGWRVYRTLTNPNYWFKKAQRWFEMIRQGNTFDNTWRSQSIALQLWDRGCRSQIIGQK